MPALVLAEHDGKTVRPATLNTVTAAAKAGGEVHILVAGHNAADAANEAAKISGVSKVFLADGAQFADGLAEADRGANGFDGERLYASVCCCDCVWEEHFAESGGQARRCADL